MQIESRLPKISVKIWQPIIDKFEEKIQSACLRRDAYLAKVLTIEVEQLDDEVSIPNSKESHDYVADRLDTLDRKLVSLALPYALTARLNAICRINASSATLFSTDYFCCSQPRRR